jgi:hypothetical protein
MDIHLAIYAERLQVRVPYARGDRNDRRTCIEFLERITSQAKSSLLKKDGDSWVPFPEPLSEWREAHALLISWGNRASHTGSLIRGETEELIESCERSLAGFRCSTCKEPVWYADQGNRDRLQCQCGELVWKYK